MAYNLIVTDTAEQHALGAAMYYEDQQTGLGDRFLNELEKAYQKIAEHPQYYSYISSDAVYRDLAIDKFPYVVIYQIHIEDVIIIDIFNTYRKPLF